MNITEHNERLALNMAEAARLMGVSIPTMKALANQKGFPAIRVGKRWLIPVDAFKAWLTDEATKTTRHRIDSITQPKTAEKADHRRTDCDVLNVGSIEPLERADGYNF